MAIVLGVAFTIIGSSYETVEAGWLSKAWDRLDFVDYNDRWFYGRLKYRSDYRVGISFEHKGNKVTKIIID